MKTLYAILAILTACSATAIAGFDGGNAPGGQQVGGKWYNPNQGGGQNSGTPAGGKYQSGKGSVPSHPSVNPAAGQGGNMNPSNPGNPANPGKPNNQPSGRGPTAPTRPTSSTNPDAGGDPSC